MFDGKKNFLGYGTHPMPFVSGAITGGRWEALGGIPPSPNPILVMLFCYLGGTGGKTRRYLHKEEVRIFFYREK